MNLINHFLSYKLKEYYNVDCLLFIALKIKLFVSAILSSQLCKHHGRVDQTFLTTHTCTSFYTKFAAIYISDIVIIHYISFILQGSTVPFAGEKSMFKYRLNVEKISDPNCCGSFGACLDGNQVNTDLFCNFLVLDMFLIHCIHIQAFV